MGEDKVYSFDTKHESLVEPQIIEGIFKAVRGISLTKSGNIEKLHFYNMLLFSKAYDQYCLRILIDEKIEGVELIKLFETLSKEIDDLLVTSPPSDDSIFDEETFRANLEKFLEPFSEDPLLKLTNSFGDFLIQDEKPKIALVGLSEVGKTSIKNIFFEKWSKEVAIKTKPTAGSDFSHHFQEFLLHKIIVMDLGGQSTYRNIYLEKKDIWSKISALIFIIDIQDVDSFILARNYLTDVWRIISSINKKLPPLSLFMHKYDQDKRNSLNKNISNCLDHFKDFIEIANIYLTTVKDSSSNTALIKVLYHSLPGVVILRILERGFSEYFNNQILPQFSMLARRLSIEGYDEIFNEFKDDIFNNAIKIGEAYGLSFQKKWLDHLMGDWSLNQETVELESLNISLKDQSLTISIKTYTEQDYPEELTTLLLSGILEGILNTLNLDPPRIVQRGDYITWIVDL